MSEHCPNIANSKTAWVFGPNFHLQVGYDWYYEMLTEQPAQGTLTKNAAHMRLWCGGDDGSNEEGREGYTGGRINELDTNSLSWRWENSLVTVW